MATEQSVMAVIRASRPVFRNAHDKVTFAVHASFISAGFILHATGPSAFVEDVLSSTFIEEVGIDQWNEFEDNYAFVYSSPEKGLKKVLMKCLALNDKLLVDVLKEGDSEPLHFEINVNDYAEVNGGTNYNSQYKNIGKLVGDIEKEVLGKLSSSSNTSSSRRTPSYETGGIRDTRSAEPSTGITDPDVTTPFHPRPYVVPLVPGFGGSDLFPGPGAGVYPTRGGFGGGGMLVGPNDPRFFGGMGGRPGFPAGSPPGVLPPGARFDPYGPPGVPGFEPHRFVRDPRGPGGRTHPDLEHFGGDPDII